jgi:putative endonuclease
VARKRLYRTLSVGSRLRGNDVWGEDGTVEKQPVVYLLASRRHGTLYIGVTSNLPKRMQEHREGLIPGFTREYGVRRLVWFEAHETIEAAILREKQLKQWRRAWKIELIETTNPHWEDLAVTMLGFLPLPT